MCATIVRTFKCVPMFSRNVLFFIYNVGVLLSTSNIYFGQEKRKYKSPFLHEGLKCIIRPGRVLVLGVFPRHLQLTITQLRPILLTGPKSTGVNLDSHGPHI